MLTKEEKDFIRYWEQNSLRRKRLFRQLLVGIPVGLLFVIPIAIYFSSGLYRKADMEANSPDFNPMVLLVAFLAIVGFTAIFYQRHQWDQYEQHYRELRIRQDREENKGEVGEGMGKKEPEPAGEGEEEIVQPDEEKEKSDEN